MKTPWLRIVVVPLLAVASVSFAEHTGKTLRMAITQDEGTLTPYSYQTGYPGYELMTLIYDTLYLMDAGLEPQPWLASGTEISADGLTYTVTLKDDLAWQDGEPLTAADVAFTIQYFKDNLLGRFTTAANKVAEVATPNTRTAILTLHAVDATFLANSLTDIPILPEHVWSDVTAPDTMAQPMGSGPYVLAEYRPDQYYRLEENPNFWGPPPALDTIIAPVIRDQTATFQALQAGEIDVAVRNVSPELVDRFAARDDIEVAQGPGFASTIVIMDVTQGALANPDVRRVMAGAIDYGRLIDVLLLGFGTSGPPGFLPPASPMANPETQEYERLTPGAAQARLEELGFARNAAGVYADGDGNELAFEFLTYADNPIRLRAAELISQDLRVAGFDITIRTMEREALVERVWPGFDVSQGRNYQMSMFGWSAPVAAQARLGSLMHADPAIGNLNLSGYSNPDADRLIDEAAVTTDDEARKAMMFDLQEILAQDLPLITLFYEHGVFAYRPAAYDNWTFMAGQGIINKNSFVSR